MIAYNLSNSREKIQMRLILENLSRTPNPSSEEVKKLVEIVKKMPDICKNKVKALKREIESEKYQICPEATSEKIIDSYKQLCGKD